MGPEYAWAQDQDTGKSEIRTCLKPYKEATDNALMTSTILHHLLLFAQPLTKMAFSMMMSRRALNVKAMATKNTKKVR